MKLLFTKLLVDCRVLSYAWGKQFWWSFACLSIQTWLVRYPCRRNQSSIDTPPSAITFLLAAGLQLMPQRFKIRTKFCFDVVIKFLAYSRRGVFITPITPHDHACRTHISCLANWIVQINLKKSSQIIKIKLSSKRKKWKYQKKELLSVDFRFWSITEVNDARILWKGCSWPPRQSERTLQNS